MAFFVIAPYFARLGDKNDMADKRIDWIGGVIVSTAICLFTFSLTDSGIAERDGPSQVSGPDGLSCSASIKI